MNIAFCVNRLGMIGLGATVSSLVRNCSANKKLKIYFLCNHIDTPNKQRIHILLQKENFNGEAIFIDIDPDSVFKGLRSLHGDFTTYGRLLLADLIPEDQVLYLDSDLIIEIDVLDVENFDFKGKAIAAVDAGTIRSALESKFYIDKLCINPETSSFNAGVILFNLFEWRSKNIKDKCLELGYNYPNDLLSCDQSILNGLFAGDFERLPVSFNCPWYASEDRPFTTNKTILHFVGSPKPWDVLGKLFHKGFGDWKNYTPDEWYKVYNRLSIHDLRRLFKIRRSYARIFFKMAKKL